MNNCQSIYDRSCWFRGTFWNLLGLEDEQDFSHFARLKSVKILFVQINRINRILVQSENYHKINIYKKIRKSKFSKFISKFFFFFFNNQPSRIEIFWLLQLEDECLWRYKYLPAPSHSLSPRRCSPTRVHCCSSHPFPRWAVPVSIGGWQRKGMRVLGVVSPTILQSLGSCSRWWTGLYHRDIERIAIESRNILSNINPRSLRSQSKDTIIFTSLLKEPPLLFRNNAHSYIFPLASSARE